MLIDELVDTILGDRKRLVIDLIRKIDDDVKHSLLNALDLIDEPNTYRIAKVLFPAALARNWTYAAIISMEWFTRKGKMHLSRTEYEIAVDKHLAALRESCLCHHPDGITLELPQ